MTEHPPVGTAPTQRIAAIVVSAEALGVVAAAVLAGYAAITAEATSGGSAWALVAFAVLAAAATGALAWGLIRGQAWARGPAIVLQLLLVPIGSYMVSGGLRGLGLAVIGWGLLALALLLMTGRRG